MTTEDITRKPAGIGSDGPARPDALRLREEVLAGEVGVIAIGGDAGTGTTSLARKIRARFGLSSDNTFLVGEAARALKSEMQGDNKALLNRMLDSTQEATIVTADPKTPALVESRLGPFLLSKHHHRTNGGIAVLLTASDQSRWTRIKGREIGKEIEKTGKAIEEATLNKDDQSTIETLQSRLEQLRSGDERVLPLAEVARTEDKRKKEDFQRLKDIYPWFRKLHLRNPFSPSAKGADGKNIYDIVIDTNNLTEEEVFEDLCRKIIEFRASEEFKKRTNIFPREADVFTASA